MPANHCMPHTEEAKAKMRAAHIGKPAPWKHRPSKEVDGILLYRCGRCGEFLPKDCFHKSKRSSLGIKSESKPCHSAVSIATRDPETTRAAGRRNEATRRARKAGADGRVTAADWRLVLSILGERCLCCGSEAMPTQDHIVPLSKGGRHHPTNLQPLCRICNERKQARAHDYRTPEQRAAVESLWLVEFKQLKGGAQ
jgi:5-methylcytosine-specific restriction endonuclease McrA